jgi:hypothetical protein|tara:strand:- start:58 stop:1569 length:1512 start_codon:yes stop_codon:yes gene_type:complete
MEPLMGISNYVRQVKPRQEKSVNHLEKIQTLKLSEAAFADLFKRNNHASFLQKIKDGELISSDGSKFPKLSSSDELVKLWPKIKDEDDELKPKIQKLIRQRFGAMGKIPKAENGFSPPSSGKPSGEDWEALIVCATRKTTNDSSWNNGPEWKRIEKFWSDYEIPAMKLGVDFAKAYGSDMEQWGSKGNMTTASRWKGKNKTPKTDIMSGKKYKISLKKSGGSQLMSAGQAETISTFEAAMETFSESNNKQIFKVISEIEEKMGGMTEKGTITDLEKRIVSGKKLSDKDTKSAAELSVLNTNTDELNASLNNIFQSLDFKSHFCFEAATGNIKFEPTPDAAANVIVTFKDSGSIENTLKLDSPTGAGKTIAKGNSFFVSFKTGGGASKPFLALRSRKLAKKDIIEELSFKNIVFEELQSAGIILTEELMQLDEFSLFKKIKGKASAVAKNIASKIQKVYNAIIKRLKEAFNTIKSLGKRMLSALLKFFGFVPQVKVSGGGAFPL